MFKKGVITDEISQDFKTAASLAVKYGLDGVEIRSVWDKGPHELDDGDINNIKSILSETGLEVCGISSPFNKCDMGNTAEMKANVGVLRKSINLAHQLDTKFIRGFTFWKKGSFEDNFDKIVANFEDALKIVEKEDVILVLEFDPSVYATNAKKLARVISAINSPYVKALWDPGNDIYDPDGERPYPDGYEIIKPYMLHMHLKDARKLPDGKVESVPIGEGDVDYEGQFKELIRSGYNGFVVLETHYRPKHDIGEELMALPKGSAFSYLGYEATEECLIKWNKLMKRIMG